MSKHTGIAETCQRLKQANEAFEPYRPDYEEFNREAGKALSNSITVLRAKIYGALLGTGVQTTSKQLPNRKKLRREMYEGDFD